MSKTPKLCKQGKLAYVRIHGRKVYLGIHGTTEAQREYHRVIAEFHANASAPPKDKKSITLDELCLRFLEYKQDKISATQWDNYKNLVDIVLTQYSGLPAHEFSPNKLRTLRVEFVKRGYVRQQCNKRAGHVRSIFKWGVSHELIAADIWNALRSLEYIKKGETIAPEGKKRRAIPLEHIERTLAELSPTLAAMARIHLATAARPSEICLMRIENIDRTEFLFAISDYAPFLDEGYPALYFTDTAEYRNKHYHEKTDTWDKLDYDRLTQVSVGMYRIIQAIDAAHAPK